MNPVQSTLRGWLVWLLPFSALVLLLLWQTDWGRTFLRVPPPESGIVPQPLALSMLPEYRPPALSDNNRDVVDRSLFNPTRRAAPSAIAEVAKPRMQRGQFALSGTLVIDGKATAFLREVNGGKSRRVAQGETVNGMLVAEIKPDRIRFALGDETEELALKIAVGPKTTIQPVVAAVAGGSPITAAAATPGANPPQPREVADVLAERRRAARETEAATAARLAGAPSGVAAPATAPAGVSSPTMSAAPAAAPGAGDPNWASVYQRYQQPRH